MSVWKKTGFGGVSVWEPNGIALEINRVWLGFGLGTERYRFGNKPGLAGFQSGNQAILFRK